MSILNTIKKLLGICDDSFDLDIIACINTAIISLVQIGVGPTEGFVVIDDTQTFEDFCGTNLQLESVKMYIYLKTKLMFDPPSNSNVTQTFEKSISEIEWRLNRSVETSNLTYPDLEDGDIDE